MAGRVALDDKYTPEQYLETRKGRDGLRAYARQFRLGDLCATEDGQRVFRAYLDTFVIEGRSAEARSPRTGFVAGTRSTLTSDDTELRPQPRVEEYVEPVARQDRTLYEPLYDITVDETLPEDIHIDVYGPYAMVLERITATGEVRFGSVGSSQKKATLATWVGGFEVTEDMIVYDQRYRAERLATAAGKADIKLRNHLHLTPIISPTTPYAGDRNIAFQMTAAVDADPNADAKRVIATIQAGLDVLPNATFLLTTHGLIWRLSGALNMVYPNNRPVAVNDFIDTSRIITYRGSKITLPHRRQELEETVEYPGVTGQVAYLITAQEQLQSWVKHYLRYTVHEGDMSRLIVQQHIARERLGVFADLSGELGVIRLNFG